MYQLLLVDDDPEIRLIINRCLTTSGRFLVFEAADGKTAEKMAKEQPFDVILLDIMLPDADGIELCAVLRKTVFCPILFISCMDDEETIVRALTMGGDDYIQKPFRSAVLIAHIEAVMRRCQTPQERQGDVRLGEICLSLKEHALIKKNEKVYLSPTEFKLLMYFIEHPNTLLPFEEIYTSIWKKPSCGDLRTVFSHVKNLRHKLEMSDGPELIVTYPRSGYLFQLPS